MGRNNSDFAAGLYHGTAYPFKPGDIVEPRMHRGAFATTDADIAAHYADNRVGEYNEANNATEEPKVFQVEPVNPATVNKYGNHAYASVDGFRVVKRVK